MRGWGRLMGWLRGRRHRAALPPGLVRVHPDDLRAAAMEREQARIADRLAALGVRVDVPTRDQGERQGRGGNGATAH